MNYRDGAGRLVPIDDRLVAGPGGSFRNAANSFGVSLPSSLGGAPVRFSTGSSWVSFSLDGAHGAGVVSGSRDRFAGALPGTDVGYTVGNVGLKEALVLHGSRVPASFSWVIGASAGLAASVGAGGAVSFKDGAGRVAFVLPSSFMYASGAPARRGACRAV